MNIIFIVFALALTSAEVTENNVQTESTASRTNKGISSDDLERILKRLEDSETLTQRLLNRVEQLEAQDQLQQEEIRKLKLKLRSNNEVSPRPIHHKKLNDIKKDSKLDSLHSITSIDMNVDASQKMPEKAKSKIVHVRNAGEHQRIRQLNTNPSRVAFFATLSHHQEHIGINQPIVFDNVTTNIGNGYHNHVGTFIAPLQGTYVFSVTLMSHHNIDGHFRFAKNAIPFTYMYLSGSEAGYPTVSQTVVLNLQQGDDVHILNTDTDKKLFGYGYCLFSGFLLFEGQEGEIIG